MSWPPRMLVMIIAASIGTRIAPELVTLLPTTPCTKTGRKKIAPNIDIATPTLAILENAKMLLFHSRSGSTGSGVRLSIQTKAMSETADAPQSPMICHEVHGESTPAHIVARQAEDMAKDSVTLPH